MYCKTTPVSLCSHPVSHPNLTREVRRSPTWHSSKSESALERFEPVAVDKLRLDGSLAMFAPEGDGFLKRAWREDAGRIHKAGTTLCDFCRAFGHSKARKEEKFLYVSSRANDVRPLSRRRQHTCFAYVLIPPTMRVVDGADPYKINLNIPNPNKTSAPRSRSFVFIFPYLLLRFVCLALSPAPPAVGISGSVKCLP